MDKELRREFVGRIAGWVDDRIAGSLESLLFTILRDDVLHALFEGEATGTSEVWKGWARILAFGKAGMQALSFEAQRDGHRIANVAKMDEEFIPWREITQLKRSFEAKPVPAGGIVAKPITAELVRRNGEALCIATADKAREQKYTILSLKEGSVGEVQHEIDELLTAVLDLFA